MSTETLTITPKERMLESLKQDIVEAAIAWYESHPVTDETRLLSGYLYDRVRRFKQAIERQEGKVNG